MEIWEETRQVSKGKSDHPPEPPVFIRFGLDLRYLMSVFFEKGGSVFFYAGGSTKKYAKNIIDRTGLTLHAYFSVI